MTMGGADDLALTVDDYADGEVIFHNPMTGERVTKYRIDDNTYALKREYYRTQELLDACAEDRAASLNTRWGDGRIIGRIPMNILQDDQIGLMDAIKNYDDGFLTRFLQDNPALKTRDRI